MLRSEDTSFEETAKKLAEAIGGEAENTGGDVWLAMKELENGSFLVFSLEEIGLYKSRQSMEEGDRPRSSVQLHGENPMEEKRCKGCSEIIESGEVFFRWEVDGYSYDYCWMCDGALRQDGAKATDGAKRVEYIKTIQHGTVELSTCGNTGAAPELNGRGETIAEEIARDL
jgi:hypothetical protein